MEHLSTRLCHRILAYLDLYDLRSLMLVSKKMVFTVVSFEIDELVVHNRWKTRRTKSNWFHLNQPNNFLRQISEQEIGLLFPPPAVDSLIQPDQLRRLKLDAFDKCPRRLCPEDLNGFTKLEILDIDMDNLTCVRKTIHQVFLANLTALRLRTFRELNIHFVMPRLKALDLCTYHTDTLQFSHPLSVKRLGTFRCNRDLAVFANVVYLECYDSLDEETLISFPKLRTLRVESRNNLMPLLQQRNARERIEPNKRLNIYQFGVLLRYGNELDAEMLDDYLRYYNLYLNRLPFYLRNYNLLAGQLRYAENLNYNMLRDWILEHHNDIARFHEFYERFNEIRIISVHKPVDDRCHLMRLIYNSSCLCHLKLIDSGLDQRFYDSLPEISCLFVLQVAEGQYVGLRFEFVGRMKLLQTFRTNQDLELTDQYQLNTMKHLRQFEFKINDRQLTVEVRPNDPEAKYAVRFSNQTALAEKRTFGELVTFCEHFRNRDQDVIVEEYLNVNRPAPRRRRFLCELL